MSGSIDDLIRYRIERAYETLADARLLADSKRWNSCINRLYYASFYSVSALLLKNNMRTYTHNGCKSKFPADFITFDQDTVSPLLEQTEKFIIVIEKLLK